MKTLKHKQFKTPILAIIAITFVFSFGIFSTPKEASAIAVPVIDAGANVLLGSISGAVVALEATQAAALAQQTLYEQAMCAKEVGPACVPGAGIGLTLDGIGNFAAKTVAGKMVNGVTNWVRNGFNGSPAFVEDFKTYIEDLALAAALDVASDIAGANVCNFFPDITGTIMLSTRAGNQQAFRAQAECTIDDIVADAEGFYDDFTTGSWVAFEASLEKNNNPFGLYIGAQEELNRRTAERTSRETQKLAWGRGFLSFEDANGNVKTPGAMIETQLGDAMGFDLAQLEIADELDELAAAVISSVVRTALSGAGFI